MRIGTENNSLAIELNPLDGGYTAFRAEAVATASGRRFTACHDRLILDSDAITLQRCADFETLESHQVEIRLSEGGWIRLQRTSHGQIIVRYRIAASATAAAMEGEVVVDGEYANAFCRDFNTLLRA